MAALGDFHFRDLEVTRQRSSKVKVIADSESAMTLTLDDLSMGHFKVMPGKIAHSGQTAACRSKVPKTKMVPMADLVKVRHDS